MKRRDFITLIGVAAASRGARAAAEDIHEEHEWRV
jgi:hypothetical protein